VEQIIKFTFYRYLRSVEIKINKLNYIVPNNDESFPSKVHILAMYFLVGIVDCWCELAGRLSLYRDTSGEEGEKSQVSQNDIH
jgi:hypothetical protein